MAAVNSKVMNGTRLSVLFFVAIVSSIVIYFIITQIEIWNDCQSLRPTPSSSSSSLLTRLEKLHSYFCHLFNLTDSHPSRNTKWNHENIAELCNENFLTVSVFILTSQTVYDVKLIIVALFDTIYVIFNRILETCKSIVMNFTQEKDNHDLNYFCLLISLLAILGTCAGITHYYQRRKRKYSENNFTSLTPYKNYNYNNNNNTSSSLALTRSRLSRYDETYSEGKSKYDHLQEQKSISSIGFSIIRWILFLVAFSIVVSIPWEFVRLYQAAVAHRAANVNMGLPPECSPNTAGWLDSIKTFLRWHLSWSHHHNPCTEYYYATLVDPVWEVNPLLVLSSVLSRGIVHPFEVVSSALGRSIRTFFAEIPAHWQPVIMLVVIATVLAFLLVLSSYRVSIPLLLRIEPKTPVSSPADTKSCAKSRKSRLGLPNKSRQKQNQPNSRTKPSKLMSS